jgi:hypothetical protein
LKPEQLIISFKAVGDEDVALFIDMTDVSGMEAAVDDHLRRGFGLVPIAHHHLRPAETDLAGLAGFQQVLRSSSETTSQIVPGTGRPIEPGFRAAVRRVDTGHRRGFAQAIAFQQGGTRLRLEGLGDFERQGRAAGDADVERGEIEILRTRRVEERVVERRHAGHRIGMLARDQAQQLQRIEARLQQHAGAEGKVRFITQVIAKA